MVGGRGRSEIPPRKGKRKTKDTYAYTLEQQLQTTHESQTRARARQDNARRAKRGPRRSQKPEAEHAANILHTYKTHASAQVKNVVCECVGVRERECVSVGESEHAEAQSASE